MQRSQSMKSCADFLCTVSLSQLLFLCEAEFEQIKQRNEHLINQIFLFDPGVSCWFIVNKSKDDQ